MNIAIVDDEKSARENIRSLIEQNICENNLLDIDISCFSSGEELLASGGQNFDIVYLDIDMDGQNGIDVSSQISQIKRDMIIIFVTSYDCYTKEAFRNNAFQYLTKPVEKVDFDTDFARALEALKKKNTRIKIISNNIEYSLKMDSILYIESKKRLAILHMREGKTYECYSRLSDLGERLAQYDFAFTHKSFCVNLNAVVGFGYDMLELENGEKIPISRGYRQELKRRINIFLSGVEI